MSSDAEKPGPENQEGARAGFAAVIGAPNAGKSTLVNRLVGSKVSIVTQKVQTTRFPVRGVAMQGEAQVILVDTPGIFKPRRRLDRAMVRSAWGGAEDADAVVHLVDAHAEIAVREGGAKGAEARPAGGASGVVSFIMTPADNGTSASPVINPTVSISAGVTAGTTGRSRSAPKCRATLAATASPRARTSSADGSNGVAAVIAFAVAVRARRGCCRPSRGCGRASRGGAAVRRSAA